MVDGRQEAFQDAVDALKLQPSLARAHAARGAQHGNVMGKLGYESCRKVGTQQTNTHGKSWECIIYIHLHWSIKNVEMGVRHQVVSLNIEMRVRHQRYVCRTYEVVVSCCAWTCGCGPSRTIQSLGATGAAAEELGFLAEARWSI